MKLKKYFSFEVKCIGGYRKETVYFYFSEDTIRYEFNYCDNFPCTGDACIICRQEAIRKLHDLFMQDSAFYEKNSIFLPKLEQ